MSLKKILIIISIILVVLILGLVGYYFMITSGGTNSSNVPSLFKSFFPFGGPATSTPETPNNPFVGIATSTPTINYTQKLREIWALPVAGFGLLDSKLGTVVRHVEVATGFVFETELFSPLQNRISNKTMPLVYNAVWGNSNQSFVAQFLENDLDTVDTDVFSVNKNSTTTENAISGYVLAGGVSNISVLGNNMFYLTVNTNGTQGFISGMDGLKRKQVWNSPLKEILSQVVNATNIAITTKPYPNISGYLYMINTSTGTVKKVLDKISGLSDLVSPDLSKVLFLYQTSTARLYLYDIKSQIPVTLTPVTFPEKCVWSKKDVTVVYCAVPRESLDGSSLTAWYMGQISFTDDIWKYDLKQNTSVIIANLTDLSGGKTIDTIKPQLSDGEQYLVFINKIDGSLWSLDLTK